MGYLCIGQLGGIDVIVGHDDDDDLKLRGEVTIVA